MTSYGFFSKKTRRLGRFFNMVECALALAVVAIGVVSIVALFPVGMEASRDAIADSYAADSADNFLSYFKGQLQNTDTGWSYYVTGAKIPTTKPYIDSGTGLPADGKEDDTKWTAFSETPLVENHAKLGVFRVQVKSGIASDFSGVFRLWQSPVSYSYWDGAIWQVANVASDKAIALNVEVSWPAQAPYDKRRRAIYYLEVFNPN